MLFTYWLFQKITTLFANVQKLKRIGGDTIFVPEVSLSRNSRLLILFPESESLFADKIKERGFTLGRIYKNIKFATRIVRKAHLKSFLPLKHYWYGDWKKTVACYDTIIIFDSLISLDVVKWIERCKHHPRIIVWFRNPTTEEVVNELRDASCELWSFDPSDCKKFGMEFNNQFYFRTIEIKKSEEIYDLLFVGRDKNRRGYLETLRVKLLNLGVRPYFHIVSDCKLESKRRTIDLLSYTEVLKLISQSRAILDVVQSGQRGMTLRALEALFLNRKLVTNNKFVLEERFYDRRNVFLLGQDNLVELPMFLRNPPVQLSEQILNEYDFDSWISRFGIRK